jgi:hypothetical protein
MLLLQPDYLPNNRATGLRKRIAFTHPRNLFGCKVGLLPKFVIVGLLKFVRSLPHLLYATTKSLSHASANAYAILPAPQWRG